MTRAALCRVLRAPPDSCENTGMLLKNDVSVNLMRHNFTRSYPFKAILSELTKVDFGPEGKQLVQNAIVKHGLRPGDFNLSAFDDGGYLFSEAIMYPPPEKWRFEIFNSEESLQYEVEPEHGRVIAQLIRLLTKHDDEARARQLFRLFAPEAQFDRLLSASQPRPEPWPLIDEPGVYRREHASFAIRSRTTSILFDPVRLLKIAPGIVNTPPPRPGEKWDAILISHGHDDHWHIPSLLSESDPDTTIVVPRLERTSLLTPMNFSSELALIGQKHAAPAWGETIRIGDIEIDILPFYGEQPTRAGPVPYGGMRSMGNCFRVNTPDFSVLVLIDSGTEPGGDMVPVIEESVRKRGPFDLVMCCLREFHSPFFGGLATYWATLPIEGLRALWRQFKERRLPLTTAGPKDAAEVMRVAKARYFLPYAHGFEKAGVPISDVSWGAGDPSETEMVKRMASHLKFDTKCPDWNCGDRAAFRGGQLVIDRYRDLPK
ncbi:MAG TPA: MBL fold metallo-hydrolase [Bdellovibrionales bacterium]|nr:MBL fold metallo-hydrolase [Bdellovibrionales bacterium]